MLNAECKKYVEWCEKYHLNKNDYQNLFLFTHKSDMGFIFQDYQDAKENGVLTQEQINAVEELDIKCLKVATNV